MTSGTIRPFQYTQHIDTPLRKHVKQLQLQYGNSHEHILEELISGSRFDFKNASHFGQLRGTIVDTPAMSRAAQKLMKRSKGLEAADAYRHVMYATSNRNRLISPTRYGLPRFRTSGSPISLLSNRHQDMKSLLRLSAGTGFNHLSSLMHNPSFVMHWERGKDGKTRILFDDTSRFAAHNIYTMPCVSYELFAAINNRHHMFQALQNRWLTPSLALRTVHLSTTSPQMGNIPESMLTHFQGLPPRRVMLDPIMNAIKDPLLQLSALRELVLPDGGTPGIFFTDWEGRKQVWLNALIPEEDFAEMPSRFTEPIFLDLLFESSSIPPLGDIVKMLTR